ncbi:MAG: FtsW/RodA/SpoVE family cell cycle protein, partial [Candidatus Limnocylindria bacterium]
MGATTLTTTLVDNVRARRWRAFDGQLLLYVVLLIGMGVVMSYSANYAGVAAGDGLSQTVKTLIWAAIGLIIFFAAASVDYHWLQTLTVPIYAVVLGLLALTMLIGTNLFGAQMSITVAGLDFQFS